MMKHFTVLALLLMVLWVPVIGQSEINVKWGSRMEWEKLSDFKEMDLEIIGKSGGFIYCYSSHLVLNLFTSGAGDYTIYKFDEELNLVKKMEYSGRKLGRRLIRGIFLVKGKLMVISSKYERRRNYVYGEILNKESLLIEREVRQIGAFSILGKELGADYELAFSPDSTKVLAFAERPFYPNLGKKPIPLQHFLVFDSDLTPIWQTEIQNLKGEPVFLLGGIDKLALDNEGNLTFMGILADRVSKKNIPIIKKIDTRGKVTREYAWCPKELDPVDYSMIRKPNGRLLIGGFYTDSKWISGVFLVEIDLKKEDRNVTVKEIPEEQRQSFYATVPPSKVTGQYRMKELTLVADGRIELIAERYHFYMNTNASNDISAHRHYYMNILAVKISPDKDIEWVSSVPKANYASNPDLGSFIHMELPKGNGFLFNTEQNDCGQLPPPKLRPLEKTKACIVLVTINDVGAMETHVLDPVNNVEGGILPQKSCQLDEKSMLFYFKTQDYHRFGILSLN